MASTTYWSSPGERRSRGSSPRARHFNYLGEGFLALSIALVFGHFGNPWAWTYFVFVVSFFTVRQRFDEQQCAVKYGPEKWAEYQARAKYRIFPGIY